MFINVDSGKKKQKEKNKDCCKNNGNKETGTSP